MSKTRRLLLIASGTTLSFSLTTYYLSRRTSQSSSLNHHSFTPWTLTSKTPVTSNSSILTLSHPNSKIPEQLWRQGTWSVEVKNPLLMVARAYTPLPPLPLSTTQDNSPSPPGPPSPSAVPPTTTPAESQPASQPPPSGNDTEGNTIKLLVRKQGETSSHLLSLPISSEVHLRGPHPPLPLPSSTSISDIIFLAGGTGIAPALQLAYRSLLSSSPTRFSVLYCVRDEGDCAGGQADTALLPSRGWFASTPQSRFEGRENAVVEMPHAYRSALATRGSSMEIAFFPDQSSRPSIRARELRHALSRHHIPITAATVQSAKEAHSQITAPPDTNAQMRTEEPGQGLRVLVVSGPPGFVEYYAGPKVWANGQETQGPLGGVLGQLRKEGRLEGWEVYKL